MDKLKTIILTVLGALSVFFMFVIQRKNRKIEQQQNEIKQHKSKNKELQFINEQESKSKHEKNTINTSSESDVDKLLEQTKSYRD